MTTQDYLAGTPIPKECIEIRNDNVCLIFKRGVDQEQNIRDSNAMVRSLFKGPPIWTVKEGDYDYRVMLIAGGSTGKVLVKAEDTEQAKYKVRRLASYLFKHRILTKAVELGHYGTSYLVRD